MGDTPAVLPLRGPLLTRAGWSAFIVSLLVVCALAPLLNLVVPDGSVFHMSDYAVALVGKIMCYAICALAMDLIWGYTGSYFRTYDFPSSVSTILLRTAYAKRFFSWNNACSCVFDGV